MNALALALVLQPPAEPAAPAPPVADAPAVEDPSSRLEPEPEERAFLVTTGTRPPQNGWPYTQWCDLDAEKRPACLYGTAEIFSGWRYGVTGDLRSNEFVLDRAEAGTGLAWRPHRMIDAGGEIRFEALRSAGPQSLQGIDGNALVVRAWQAYGQFVVHAGPIDIGSRVGLVPERWIEQVEKGYDTRGIAPLGSESRAMFDTADLGATFTVSGWKNLVDLDLSVVNGEGRSQREQNTGKNTTAMLTVRPLRRQLDRGPLTVSVHGVYRDGSLGVASARNHRAGGAATFRSPWAFVGAEYVAALGYQERAEQRADVLSAWASGHVWAPWIGLFARYSLFRPDVEVDDASVNRLTAGVFGDLFPFRVRNARRVRLHLGYEYEGVGDGASAVPGAPAAATAHRFLVQVQARGMGRLHFSRRPVPSP